MFFQFLGKNFFSKIVYFLLELEKVVYLFKQILFMRPDIETLNNEILWLNQRTSQLLYDFVSASHDGDYLIMEKHLAEIDLSMSQIKHLVSRHPTHGKTT